MGEKANMSISSAGCAGLTHGVSEFSPWTEWFFATRDVTFQACLPLQFCPPRISALRSAGSSSSFTTLTSPVQNPLQESTLPLLSSAQVSSWKKDSLGKEQPVPESPYSYICRSTLPLPKCFCSSLLHLNSQPGPVSNRLPHIYFLLLLSSFLKHDACQISFPLM